MHSHAAQEPVNFHAVAHDVADPFERHLAFAVNCKSLGLQIA